MRGGNQFSSKTHGSSLIGLEKIQQILQEWAIKAGEKRDIQCARRADELLADLERNYDAMWEERPKVGMDSAASGSNLIPTDSMYNKVIHAYAQSEGGTEAARCSEEVLDRMIQRCRLYQERHSFKDESTGFEVMNEFKPPPEPTVRVFNSAIDAWAKSRDEAAGKHAERIYTKMERWTYVCKLYNDANSTSGLEYKGVNPTANSLAIVIDAWAKSLHQDAADRVLAILDLALQKHRQMYCSTSQKEDEGLLGGYGLKIVNEEDVIALNEVVFHSVLHTLATVPGNRKNAELAQQVFSLMEDLRESSAKSHALDLEPNTRTWTLLLQCWTNAVNHESDDGGIYAAQRADDILTEMETLYHQGENVRPNIISVTSCITAWANCRSDIGASKALSILERFEAILDCVGEKQVKSSVYMYNACLSALLRANSDNTLRCAKALFERMEGIDLVDVISYNTMLNGCAKTNTTHFHHYASELFNNMKERNIPPDTITYNTLISVLGNSGAADNIERIIELINSLVKKSDSDPNIQPTTITFASALIACSRSNRDEKVEPAKHIFAQMISLYEETGNKLMKPDLHVFSSFLNACSNQRGSAERKRFALKAALGKYDELCTKKEEYGEPNSFIYGILMKVCGKLTNDLNEKARLMENIFLQCKEKGMMSRSVLTTFLRFSPENLKRKLLKDCKKKNFSKSFKVPSNWYRNVDFKQRP